MTVTNDIDAVLIDLADRVKAGLLVPGHPNQRVIDRDSEDYWDQVVIDDRCQFVPYALRARRR